MLKEKIAFAVVIATIILGSLLYVNQKYFSTEEKDETACPADALLCPDGSYVGRQGPLCEFEECPSRPETIEAPAEKDFENSEIDLKIE